jgi:hypothetical protein
MSSVPRLEIRFYIIVLSLNNKIKYLTDIDGWQVEKRQGENKNK